MAALKLKRGPFSNFFDADLEYGTSLVPFCTIKPIPFFNWITPDFKKQLHLGFFIIGPEVNSRLKLIL
jgi:hypothetical protein